MKLRRIEWPEFGGGEGPSPVFAAADFERRLARTRARMAERGWTHLLVYGDREHYANLLWLAGFDPRFEEALLVLGPEPSPLVITGIECEQYLRISPLFRAGGLRQSRCDAFSLPGSQPRPGRASRRSFARRGIAASSRVACAGWKAGAHDTPFWILEAVSTLTGSSVENGAGLFSDPRDGLRAVADAKEIAWFEHANAKTSDALRRVLFSIRPGHATSSCWPKPVTTGRRWAAIGA